MTATPNRQFLVARMGQQVVVREIPTGSCAQHWGRTDAWAWANKLAQPHKVSRTKVPAKDIVFMALDGTSRVVQPAGEISKAKAAATRAQAPVQPTTPQPRPQARTRPARAATTPDPVLGW